ncbi:MAG: PadR family transcriptional regulator [Candidatus Micrarchaeia archaeon]
MSVVKPKPFVKGILGLLLLVELKQAPQSGKGLAERVKRLTNGKWTLSSGTLYPTLRRLEARKCIKPVLGCENGRREIKYTLTVKGAREIERDRSEMLDRLQEAASVMLPLTMRIMHEFSDCELDEMAEEMRRFDAVRLRVFAMPPEKRRQLIKTVFKKIAFNGGVEE